MTSHENCGVDTASIRQILKIHWSCHHEHKTEREAEECIGEHLMREARKLVETERREK